MKQAKDYWDYELEDDETENGGVVFLGETLGHFCEEVEFTKNAPMEEVNEALVYCGIKPIELED